MAALFDLLLPLSFGEPSLCAVERSACSARGGCAPNARPARRALHVRAEKARGWTASAPLPGIAPSDVRVAVLSSHDGRTTLSVTARGALDERMELPDEADASLVNASLVNGQLTVAVPLKASALPVEVPVAADGDAAGQHKILYELPVVGIAPEDLHVTASGVERSVVVTGRRFHPHAAPFHRELPLPHGTAVAALSATCAHGLLTLRLAEGAAATESEEDVLSVAVSSERHHHPSSQEQTSEGMVEDDDDGGGEEPAQPLTLMELPVPGLSAAEVTVEVSRAERVAVVTVAPSAGGSRQRAAHRRRAVARLPKGVRAEEVSARCVDGLFALTALRPPQPAETTVALDTEHTATLDVVAPSRSNTADEMTLEDDADAVFV